MAELPNATVLEARFERLIARVGRKYRKELIKLLGTPPDPQNVPQSFWDKVEKETQQTTLSILLLLFMDSATLHETPPDEAELVGMEWAERRSKSLAGGFVEHSRDIVNRLGQDATVADVRDRADQVFGRERAKRIAVTETTEAQEAGGSEGAKRSVVNLLKIWSHSGTRPARHSNAAKQPCPLCSPLEGHSEGETMQMDGGAKIPRHPHCDCYWTYYDRATGETWPIGSPEPEILRSDELKRVRQALRN